MRFPRVRLPPAPSSIDDADSIESSAARTATPHRHIPPPHPTVTPPQVSVPLEELDPNGTNTVQQNQQLEKADRPSRWLEYSVGLEYSALAIRRYAADASHPPNRRPLPT